MSEKYDYDVFISYSHSDSDWIRTRLLPVLEKSGLCVCIDYRDFEIGIPSITNMERAIKHSRKTLLILTPHWVDSQWTEFEAILLQTQDPTGRTKRVLPILLKKTPLPDRLQLFTYLDLTGALDLESQLQRLVQAIRDTQSSTNERVSTSVELVETHPLRLSEGRYEEGLKRLKNAVQNEGKDRQLALATLEERLISNLRDEHIFGTSEVIRSERARIIFELNRLALVVLNQTFNELCES